MEKSVNRFAALPSVDWSSVETRGVIVYHLVFKCIYHWCTLSLTCTCFSIFADACRSQKNHSLFNRCYAR